MTKLALFLMAYLAQQITAMEIPLVNIDDFHITNPLFQNQARDIHGWEIDGRVSTEGNWLQFGGQEKGEYIIKSFIPIVS